MYRKNVRKIQNGQKLLFRIFFNNFTQKDQYKFGMAKNGCSKFFLTIFPQKTGINLEWPKMAVPIFSKKFSPKDWYKFRMATNSHSKLFSTIFPKKTSINSEWPKMAILNFCQKFFPKRLV